MIFDGARDEWTAREAALHLDRLAVNGVLTEPPRARRRYAGDLLGWIVLPIVAVGLVVLLALVLK